MGHDPFLAAAKCNTTEPAPSVPGSILASLLTHLCLHSEFKRGKRIQSALAFLYCLSFPTFPHAHLNFPRYEGIWDYLNWDESYTVAQLDTDLNYSGVPWPYPSGRLLSQLHLGPQVSVYGLEKKGQLNSWECKFFIKLQVILEQVVLHPTFKKHFGNISFWVLRKSVVFGAFRCLTFDVQP